MSRKTPYLEVRVMSSRALRVGRLLRIFLTMQARHLQGTV